MLHTRDLRHARIYLDVKMGRDLGSQAFSLLVPCACSRVIVTRGCKRKGLGGRRPRLGTRLARSSNSLAVVSCEFQPTKSGQQNVFCLDGCELPRVATMHRSLCNPNDVVPYSLRTDFYNCHWKQREPAHSFHVTARILLMTMTIKQAILQRGS